MPTVLIRVVTCLVGLLCISQSVEAGSFDQKMFPAFPGAEGAGAYTAGGRGGKVLAVTTLEDYYPGKEKPIAGSLRAALAEKGPRIVVFRVAGYIPLKTNLSIDHPHVTVAGQTAPGDGICLKDSSLQIDADDVIIRYLRVRPGDTQKRELDCISCKSQRVILDHCSTSWGIDETISTNGNAADVTVQWSIIAESLNHSVHHKGSHGYGSLISGPGEISYHHNVYAFHRSRNPRAGDVLLDFRNNLVYGWGDRAGYSGNERLRMNYVGNYLQPLAYSKSKDIAFSPGGLGQQYYLADNFFFDYLAGTEDNWRLIRAAKGSDAATTVNALRVDHAFPAASVTTQPVAEAYQSILRSVGATLPARDKVDARMIEQFRQGQGALINSQTEVGGWPALASAAAPADTDSDGMPDAWEERYHLASAKADPSAQDTDGDGYTDLEEFLNATDPTVAEPWLAPPAVGSSAGDAFLEKTTIAMTGPEGAEIRYTLDDSEPSRDSTLYVSPFEVARSATLRARSFRAEAASHVRNARLSQLPLQEPVIAKAPQPGLHYHYWENSNPDELLDASKGDAVKTGTVATISLSPRGRDAGFGIHYDGLIDVPADGIYTFYLRCSPRGALTIADQPVVESQGRKRERAGKIGLKRGEHPLTFAIHYGNVDDKTLDVDIEGPGLARQPLSPERLRHEGP